MKILFKTFAIMMVFTIFSSCASIVSKSNWPITINTNPNGAKVTITDKKDKEVYTGLTPATLKLKSGSGYFGKQSYKVKLALEGFDVKIVPVEFTFNGWYIGNLVFGGLIGLLIVDPLTGAMYRLNMVSINETLTKTTADAEPSLRIIDINQIPDSWKEHLVLIK